MAFNPMNLLKIKKQWEQFNAAHPRFMPYIKALRNGYLDEGSVLEMNVTAPDGRSLKCNIRLTAEDMELMRQISELN
ncbi:MAG: hypothetical protein K5911_02465 [Eubacteriales bacterium]|nr:hypothetical protein [Eubacteriales bacterium]